MSSLITTISSVISWLFGLFQLLFNFILDEPVILLPVALSILVIVIAIIFRVKGSLGMRSRRR